MSSDRIDAGELGVAPVRRPGGIATRAWSALIFLACAGVVGVAVWSKPDPRGFGTHQQLGSGPCGMLLWTGFPCPTCSMTTAFAHTVRGQFLSAARVQPAGFLLALATIATAIGALFTVCAGRPPHVWYWLLLRVPAHWFFVSLLIVLLAAWGYKLIYGLATHELPLRSMIVSPG